VAPMLIFFEKKKYTACNQDDVLSKEQKRKHLVETVTPRMRRPRGPGSQRAVEATSGDPRCVPPLATAANGTRGRKGNQVSALCVHIANDFGSTSKGGNKAEGNA